MKKTKLKFHSAMLVAYYLEKDRLHLIFEQKDPNYKRPYFDSGLNFLGGNYEKGKHDHSSPYETLLEEIREEFHSMPEKPESLNELLGEKFIEKEPDLVAKYDHKTTERIREMGNILTKNVHPIKDFYIVEIHPPITKDVLTYGSSMFNRELNGNEFKHIKELIDEFDGKLTTDNLKWKSKIVTVPFDYITKKNKFAWESAHVLVDLLGSELPAQPTDQIRLLDEVKLIKKVYPPTAEIDKFRCPTFTGFESLGYNYE